MIKFPIQRKNYFTLFWLPNAITLLNLFTGFSSMLLVMSGKVHEGSWLIFLSLVWDSLDGNIARALKNPSPFGRELDSLCDMVSFVAAPAMLAYILWLYLFDFTGLLAIFAFLGCGAYRLARFNVQPPVKTYFQGLPTPAAAVLLATSALAYQKNGWVDTPLFASITLVVMISLGLLMVSTIPYPKLSVLRFSEWSWLFLFEIFLIGVLTFYWNFETALSVAFYVFLVLSPFLGLKRFRQAFVLAKLKKDVETYDAK